MTRTIARYRGICEVCDQPVEPGDRIDYEPAHGVRHQDCLNVRPVRPVCPVCHMERALNGTCECEPS